MGPKKLVKTGFFLFSHFGPLAGHIARSTEEVEAGGVTILAWPWLADFVCHGIVWRDE
jgi:hypothetical protein